MKHLIFLVTVLFLGGCSLAELSMFSSNQDCSSTYDCSPGDVCHFGACVAPGGEAGEILMVLEPSPYSGYPAQADSGGERNAVAGIYHDLTLTGGSRVIGKVAVASGGSRTGTLSITSEESILGLSDTQSLHSGVDGFVVDLLPGTYTFSFVPDDADFRPPVIWAAIDVPQEGISDLVFPYPEDLGLVAATGQLVFTQQLLSPIVGAVVQGEYTTASGLTAYSSPALTDEDGHYDIVFPGPAETYRLKISPGENYFIPETTIPDLNVSEDSLIDLDILPNAQSFTVETTQADGSLVPGTTLYFQGVIQEYAYELVSFEFAVQTGAQGNSVINLLPGLYTVTAIPPRASDASVTVRELCIAGAEPDNSLCFVPDVAQGETLSLALSSKSLFSGRVYSDRQEIVPNARVTLHTKINGQRLEALTNTDDQGFFELRVDGCPDIESVYTLDVLPPNKLALPWHREDFSGDIFGSIRSVILPTPALLAGGLRAESGVPVENVAISVYSVSTDTNSSPRLIGVGTSTTGGEFLIALPAQENE
ncbi:MAG: hypothetical protein HOK97_12300 [Deltaproteobacteria bacterium]|nr:hypothetical protein [Deltaproteobacteria bacterium]MBT6490541.1 hypothetical protein [Deltaproteobacteria bacterium]